MKLVDMVCPNCGAKIQADADMGSAKCEHCGSTFILDDEAVHVKYDNAYEAGYQFEKGRQQAQAEARQRENEHRTDAGNTASQEIVAPKKRKTWLWVLGWICIFPLPLTILMLRKKDMKPVIKWGIIAVAWIAYFAIAASDETETTKDESVVESQAVVESVENSSYETIQASETTGMESVEEIETVADTAKETENAETVKSGSEIIEDTVAEFNSISESELTYVEDFTPSDRSGNHYQTEFRLAAYKDAIGKSYHLGETQVDIIERDSLTQKGILRVYAHRASADDCVLLINNFSKVLSEETTDAEIAEAVAAFIGNKEAYGYYYGDLGLVITGNDENGYEFLMKSKND